LEILSTASLKARAPTEYGSVGLSGVVQPIFNTVWALAIVGIVNAQTAETKAESASMLRRFIGKSPLWVKTKKY
jgi:hypothetical protein